jgi:hypothetical protein
MSAEQVEGPCWSPFALRERELSAAARFSLLSNGQVRIARVIALLIAITWLPLAILTIIEGTALPGSVEIAFFADHIPHGRFLIAGPLLLLLDALVERRTALAVQHTHSSGLIREGDEAELGRLVATASRAWRSGKVRAVLIAVTLIVAWTTYVWGRELGLSTWMLTGEGEETTLTAAGAWNLFVAVPLVRLLSLRAAWKFGVWVCLLFGLRRLRLQINPLHPDGRCGLRFLGTAQLAFLPIIAAWGVQLGCFIAVAVRHQGAALASFKLVGAAFVVLSVAMILGPLAIFARQAWLAIERAQDAFSSWGSLAAEHMSSRLTRASREHLPGQLSTSEISSMTDAASLFDRVIATRAIPVDMRQVIVVVVTALGSALFPLLALLPLADILRRLASILL